MVRLFVLAILIHSAIWGAEVAGIWMGETTGRNGEKQDIAFQFKTTTGVMFGDEIDLPVEDLKIEGDKISFSVTNVNYYSGSRLATVYSGTIASRERHLTPEPKGVPVGHRNKE